MVKEIGPGFRLMLAFTVLTGLVYPVVMTGLSQLIFPDQANGSLVKVDDKVVGSSLIGQNFSRREYFHPRPSAAGAGYDATASGGSNLGPTSAKLLRGATQTDNKNKETVAYDGISLRIVHYCLDNDIPYESSRPLAQFSNAQGDLDDVKLINAFNDDKTPLTFTPKTPIPPDAVTASASGLDPHISPANAELQAARVAKARNASVDDVKELVAQLVEGADIGFLGEPRVNVLTLNIAIDRRFPTPNQQARAR
jgi:potassium-transporting ATPase KdpC subunit